MKMPNIVIVIKQVLANVCWTLMFVEVRMEKISKNCVMGNNSWES